MRRVVIPVIFEIPGDETPREFIDELGVFISNCVADYVDDMGVPVDMAITVMRPNMETVQ